MDIWCDVACAELRHKCNRKYMTDRQLNWGSGNKLTNVKMQDGLIRAVIGIWLLLPFAYIRSL